MLVACGMATLAITKLLANGWLQGNLCCITMILGIICKLVPLDSIYWQVWLAAMICT